MQMTKTISALGGIRVLELASRSTRYAGKLFADMGADVILVEPSAGSRGREEDPFIGGVPGGEMSLSFAYYNAGKRGVTIDLDDAQSRADLLELVRGADLILEGEKPGALARRGLGFEALADLRPGLVMTSISPFGQSGPYSQYECEDIVAHAMGGFMYLGGYADSEPIRPYGHLAYSAAGMYAGVASMLALGRAEATGRGDHVDVSIQECVVMAMETAVQYFDLERTVRRRFGAQQRFAGTGIFPCKDGFVYMMAAGIGANKFWSRSLDWLSRERVPGAERLQGDQWGRMEYVQSDEAKRIFREVFAPWALTKTKQELYHEGQRSLVPIAPVNSLRDIMESAQLEHRGYFVEVDHPRSAVRLRMPGAPYRLSRTPWRLQGRAPSLGEHNATVFGEIVRPASPRRAAAPPGDVAGGLPLCGIRVVDFTWIGAGSYATKILADFGADVIKIESTARLDALRLSAPYKDGIKGVNRSGYFADRNTSKRSVTLNMKNPKAVDVARRLIARSDIVANNFTPDVMARFGLAYEDVCRIRPDIVYLAMSMQGASGPESRYLGFGASMAALTGLQHLTGLPGREPVGTGTNYPDHIPNPCHAAFAVLAALRHRRVTGLGQYIDMAQTEPTLAMLGPAFLELTVNGRDPHATGNDESAAAPHGAYPCRGEDRWIALAVMNDAQWRGLVDVLGGPAWALGSAWSDAGTRYEGRRTLDRKLAGETRKFDARELMGLLQQRGVPAGVVQDAEDVVARDPQLAHRRHWLRLDHPEMGATVYNAAPFRFSHAQIPDPRPAPLLGQHTDEVLGGILDMPDEEIARLRSDGALE
jgi:crotonobetainyl-CoA:carnitine CoA-transferase CaiB-like acyl-CoA transferase